MKTIPQPLLEFLLSTDVQSCYIADLFAVTLTSGLTIYITDGQMPITYNGNVYQPSQWGAWQCTGVTTGLGTTNSEANFTVMADASVLMPNWDVPLLEAVQLGLFDAAAVTILTTFGLTYGETDFGTVVRYAGNITELNATGRTSAQGQLKPDTYTLNQQMPRKVLQPGCGWVFGDDGCTINKATFTFANTSSPLTSNINLVPATPFTQADGYFTQGVITFTSGRNTGLSGFVQQHINGQLRLNKPFLFPVLPGDAFRVVAGCDHTLTTCLQKFNNSINYGGTPYIPNYETAV
jgi:uncharacterized phage protein (TIGR02218 family)